MTEINIEQGKPFVDDALFNLERQIKKSIELDRKILVIIHGYGSTGRGGKIGRAARELLDDYIKKDKISYYVEGENFDMFNENARKIKEIDKETMKYYGKSNYGVTIIKL